MNTESRVFQIPASNLSEFQSRWEKLTKKAIKLGVEVPTYSIIKEETQSRQTIQDVWDHEKECVVRELVSVPVVIHHMTISHPEVKVPGGWVFLATLEHTDDGNITHNISGEDLPVQYRDTDAYCNHCQTNRYRKETFVLRSEAGEYKQIGRNCLSLFLGIDGEKYAAMAELYSLASELGEAGESFGSGGFHSSFEYLEPYLTYVAETIAVNGWMSRTNAKQYNKPATADIAYRHQHPSPYDKKEDRLFDRPTEKSCQLAKAALTWCESIDDTKVNDSEYLHNIRLIARRGVFGAKQIGFAASIVSAFQRELVDQEKRERKQRQGALSQHVGELKKRQNFTVLVEKVIQFDSNFGTKHLHLMSDEQGNRLIWWSSSSVLDTGKTITIKATIKAHSERDGIKQTELTRCTEVAMEPLNVVNINT